MITLQVTESKKREGEGREGGRGRERERERGREREGETINNYHCILQLVMFNHTHAYFVDYHKNNIKITGSYDKSSSCDFRLTEHSGHLQVEPSHKTF